MRRKNDFRFPLGPGGADGVLWVTGHELAARVRAVNDLFPMDYVGLDAGWSGEIVIAPVDLAGVELLRQAFRTWGASGFYPPGFTDSLTRWAEQLDRLAPGAELEVEAETDPDSASLRLEFRRASGRP